MKLAKLTNKELSPVLDKLSQSLVPVKVAFKIRSLLKRVAEELETYEETRKAIVFKYADRNENGDIVYIPGTNQASISGDNVNEFAKDMKELLNMEINIGSISISDLGESFNMTARELLILDDLIVD